ncbi:restriction endonuclease subunit S [Enterococcus faecalis]|uniref:restriction endonuclease subunit S n=3 Tax=Enterococcus faecalis TaxID=1351 RepID=UPI00046C7514
MGDSVRFINGRAYKQKELLDTGKYRVLRVGNFNTNDRWYYSDLELPEEKYANKGDLLYLWATSFGPEIWDNERVIYHYHIWKLDIIDPNIDKQYLNIWLETDKERIKQNTNGTTMVHVTKSNMEQREFKLPKLLAEQEKIGYFFKQINKTITLHQRKSDQLKELKKAYLQVMFPKKDETVPRVRFTDFEGEWEQCKLGKIGKTQSGIGFPDVEQGGTEGIPFYKVSDMNNPGNEHEMINANNFVNKEQLKRKKWKPIETVPAIMFAKVGAAIMLNRKRLVTSSFLIDNNTMAYIFDNSWDTNFGKTLFETINLPRYAQVGALPSYNGLDIESIEVILPNKDEQAKIGEHFSNLENLITLHQNKLEQLNELKKSYLQNMFI